jgi:hypothetical protein
MEIAATVKVIPAANYTTSAIKVLVRVEVSTECRMSGISWNASVETAVTSNGATEA